MPVGQYTRTHVPVFVSGPLSPTSDSTSLSNTHTLELEILSEATPANMSTFRVDYLIYEATVNSTLPPSETDSISIFIDDRSEYLVYSDGHGHSSSSSASGIPGWSTSVPGFRPTDSFNLTDISFNESLIGPTSASSTVSLNFTGTQLFVRHFLSYQTY